MPNFSPFHIIIIVVIAVALVVWFIWALRVFIRYLMKRTAPLPLREEDVTSS